MNVSQKTEEETLDLVLAAELQAALLPKECPKDCPHQVAAARNRMCGSVGGDFYDFIVINDEQIAVLIGDVVGHGVRAAMVMAQIMGYLRSRPPDLARPVKVISSLNQMLIDIGERTDNVLPCSIFYAVIDAPTGICVFVNCGHPRPFICDREKCLTLPLGPRNLLLGIEDFDPLEGCHTFSPGERVVLYTDGLIDAADSEGARFGSGRLHEVVSARATDGPVDCADAVFQAVDEFRQGATQSDDETIVVIDRV